jgi:hypothetical protein
MASDLLLESVDGATQHFDFGGTVLLHDRLEFALGFRRLTDSVLELDSALASAFRGRRSFVRPVSLK